jgi:hypothetical protein
MLVHVLKQSFPYHLSSDYEKHFEKAADSFADASGGYVQLWTILRKPEPDICDIVLKLSCAFLPTLCTYAAHPWFAINTRLVSNSCRSVYHLEASL